MHYPVITDELYERFEGEMLEAETQGPTEICNAARRGIQIVDRAFSDTKKRMLVRAAQALEKFVVDPKVISGMLSRAVNGGRKGRYVRKCLPAKYKDVRYQNHRHILPPLPDRSNEANAALGPLSYDCREIGTSVRHPLTQGSRPAANRHQSWIVDYSSDGVLLHQVASIPLPMPGGQDSAEMHIMSKTPDIHSGMVVLTAVLPKTDTDIIAAFETLTSGNRNVSMTVGFADYIISTRINN